MWEPLHDSCDSLYDSLLTAIHVLAKAVARDVGALARRVGVLAAPGAGADECTPVHCGQVRYNRFCASVAYCKLWPGEI